jgi:hypothetical protein
MSVVVYVCVVLVFDDVEPCLCVGYDVIVGHFGLRGGGSFVTISLG